jgi:hypothetical protein
MTGHLLFVGWLNCCWPFPGQSFLASDSLRSTSWEHVTGLVLPFWVSYEHSITGVPTCTAAGVCMISMERDKDDCKKTVDSICLWTVNFTASEMHAIGSWMMIDKMIKMQLSSLCSKLRYWTFCCVTYDQKLCNGDIYVPKYGGVTTCFRNCLIF